MIHPRNLWRIKNGKAPWLHEAMHEMLDTKTGNWTSKAVGPLGGTPTDWKERSYRIQEQQ